MATRPAVFGARARTKADRDKDTDRWRGSAASRGYGTKWVAARAEYLAAHPLCVGCEAVGRVVPATVVDHVTPHKGDLSLFWRRGNWQAACAWHHNHVKQKLEWQWERGQANDAALRLDSRVAIGLTLAAKPTWEGLSPADFA